MDSISQAAETVRSELPSVRLRLNERMSGHTTLRIGGPARVMYFPESAGELTELCRILHGLGVTPLILGNGSNVLVCDAPMDIAVIKTTGLCGLELSSEGEITAGSGVPLSRLAVYACQHGLSGLEFAHGIPGTLGGAVLMNAGAYGKEIGEVVCSTNAYSAEKGEFETTGDMHLFSYRHSVFTGTESVLLSTSVRLKKDDTEAIHARMEDLAARRSESQPLELPSAGSVFKRPKGGYAARFIEDAGLKGYTVGGAQVSLKHAGFIVNLGNASYSDMLSVINHVQETVLKRFGVELELEVKVIRGA